MSTGVIDDLCDIFGLWQINDDVGNQYILDNIALEFPNEFSEFVNGNKKMRGFIMKEAMIPGVGVVQEGRNKGKPGSANPNVITRLLNKYESR